VLETPKGKELKEDVANLKMLRRLIAPSNPSSRAKTPVRLGLEGSR
jgi:hypothetical protein